jgi:RNA polymerase sigma factor (sigma-70 family)
VTSHTATNTLAQRCQDLLSDVRDGHDEAWERLLDEFGGLVFSVAHGAGLRGADAEDAYQATWLALHRSLPRIREPGALVAWISTTARRESWRLSKQRRGQTDLEPFLGHTADEAVAASPLDELQQLEQRESVQQGLKTLDARCQDLLQRLFFAPESPRYEEVAKAMKMKIGSVGPTRIRCLGKLALWLESHSTL